MAFGTAKAAFVAFILGVIPAMCGSMVLRRRRKPTPKLLLALAQLLLESIECLLVHAFRLRLELPQDTWKFWWIGVM